MHDLLNSSTMFTRYTRINRIYRGYDSKICDDKFDIHMPLLYMPVDKMSVMLVLQSKVDQFVVVQCKHHYIGLQLPYISCSFAI